MGKKAKSYGGANRKLDRAELLDLVAGVDVSEELTLAEMAEAEQRTGFPGPDWSRDGVLTAQGQLANRWALARRVYAPLKVSDVGDFTLDEILARARVLWAARVEAAGDGDDGPADAATG